MSEGGDLRARRAQPAPTQARRAASVVLACALGAVAGALIGAFLLTMLGLVLGGIIGAQIGYSGGPLLGAALGVSMGLLAIPALERRKLRGRADAPPAPPDPFLLRIFPEGRKGVLISWALGLLLLASPFALLRFGLLPPLSPFRLGVTVVLAAACSLQWARARHFWPALGLLVWPAVFMLAVNARFPCWNSSNAAWCGHACDGPPEAWCAPDDFGDANPPVRD